MKSDDRCSPAAGRVEEIGDCEEGRAGLVQATYYNIFDPSLTFRADGNFPVDLGCNDDL